MHEYVFELMVLASVRVRGQSEKEARQVVCSPLGSPSANDIELANRCDFVVGKQATIIDVTFCPDERSVRLVSKAKAAPPKMPRG